MAWSAYPETRTGVRARIQEMPLAQAVRHVTAKIQNARPNRGRGTSLFRFGSSPRRRRGRRRPRSRGRSPTLYRHRRHEGRGGHERCDQFPHLHRILSETTPAETGSWSEDTPRFGGRGANCESPVGATCGRGSSSAHGPSREQRLAPERLRDAQRRIEIEHPAVAIVWAWCISAGPPPVAATDAGSAHAAHRAPRLPHARAYPH